MRPQPTIAEQARRAGAGLAALLLVAGCAACGRGADGETGPAAAALALFTLSRGADPQGQMLETTFDAPPPADDRAALLDALELLAAVEEPRVVDVQTPAGPQDAFVDLDAALPGGGLAHYTVRLRASAEDSWRVSWFQGPGVEWPPPRRMRGDGLSSSAPPESPR